ncbi:MAG: hypothetical protein V3U87_00145, partial [Methylococcaceae bacterium]
VADKDNQRIQQFSAEGDFIQTWGEQGSGDGKFISPKSIAIGADGSVYVADSNVTAVSAAAGPNVIQQFNAQGEFLRSWGDVGSEDGQIFDVQDIAIVPDGSFYVSDSRNRIQKFEPLNNVTPTITFPSQGSFAEPSNTPEQAVPILVNDEPQYHLLDDAGDQDWFEFYAEQGIRYTIILPQESLGSAIDPIITLFDEAGTELEAVNSSPLGQEEVLNWTATATALFRIRVTNGTTTRAKARPAASEYTYTINVFLSDAPQQGIIKGSVVDSCQQLGLGKVVITAALSGQITESTFTHKTGEYGIPINPGNYDLNTQIVNYQDSQKNVTVQQVTVSQAPFSLAPVTDCSQIPVRVADPTLLAQQAVANYNDQTGVLIIKDVFADGLTYYAELQDQGGYHFSLTDAIELPGSVHSGSADYSFETLLVNIPAVFAFNTLYKVQMKNNGDFFFSLVDASAP